MKKFLLSIAVFLLALGVFLVWLEGFSRDNVARQRQALEAALNRSLLQCYTLEGTYPATLEELLALAPLTYDRELFFIDYRPQAGNLLPEITILENK